MEKEKPMINIDDFLLPISDEKPCGDNLRYDYVYDQIQEYRREDDSDLSQGIWKTELKKANWGEVYRLCSELLRTKTKDIQIAVWLTEALTMTDGFDGLNNGITLIKALCEKFWDNIYPKITNNDTTYRLSPFFFLIEKMRERMVLQPITDPSDSASVVYSLSDWMMARRNLQIKNVKGLSLKQIRKSVLSSSIEFFQKLAGNIKSLMEVTRELDTFLTEKCGNDAPSFKEVFECLEDIQRTTTQNLADKQKQIAEQKPKVEVVQNDSAEQQDNSSSESVSQSTDEATVEQAYDALREIAVFLEKKQPQSPASILIRIANAIGKKTFQELLEINMKSGASVMSTISELYKILGNHGTNSTSGITQ